jgi:hypothetical protein
MTIATLTPEERQISLQKAHEARIAKAAHNKANEHLYKLEYMDAPRWAELASKHKIRMPAYNQPADAKGIRKYMRKINISNELFKEHYTSVDYFLENNKRWVLYAVAGLLLEIREGM